MNNTSDIARRHFWQHLATGVMSATTPEDHVCLQLEDLPRLSAAEFFTLVPRIVDGIQIEVCEWQLLAIRPEMTEPQQLGAWLPAESWLLNQFDGTRSLDVIARAAAAKHGWSLQVARDFTRELFTRLALLRVVVPVNYSAAAG